MTKNQYKIANNPFLKTGNCFCPLACESLGGWHEVALSEVEKLASALTRQTWLEDGKARGKLWQKLSI